MSYRVTSKDVAKFAGVSPGTVSRAISGKGYLSEEMRGKINAAMKELNFQISTKSAPQAVPQNTVGIAVPEISHPYLAYIVSELEKLLFAQGYSVVLCNHLYSEDRVTSFIDELMALDASGLIMVATEFNDITHLKRANEKLSVICINTATQDDDHLLFSDYINFSDWQTTFDITEHLIELGHRNIAYMGHNPYSPPTMDRLRGYKDAMAKHNIELIQEYIAESKTPLVGVSNGDDSDSMQNKLAAKLLDLPIPPTAIMAINDYYALGVYAEAQKRGLKIGEDISVVGYDDITLATIISPQMSSVNCNITSVSYLATTTLINRINNKNSNIGTEIHNKILVPGDFKKRASIGPVKKTSL